MKRIPIIATLVVALACAIMIGLGIWQLQRADQKEALIAQYETNRAMSSEISFPELGPVPDEALFRRARGLCLEVIDWRTSGGRAGDGKIGFRHIAECRTGAEGPGMLVDMGVGSDPAAKPKWGGGVVGGVIGLEPDTASVFEHLLGDPAPLRALLVSDQAAPGLKPSSPPSTEDVPNNHFGYAIQWFLFAGVAALIFGIAAWRRAKP
jgi:surfeit locus 1 family protein